MVIAAALSMFTGNPPSLKHLSTLKGKQLITFVQDRLCEDSREKVTNNGREARKGTSCNRQV